MIGERKKNSFCTRLVLILCFASSVHCELYDYGTSYGDDVLGKTPNNIPAARMDLARAFPYGGKYHNTLFISENGVLSFGDAVYLEPTEKKNRNLPFYYDADGDGNVEDPDSIFPFWSDAYLGGAENSNPMNVFYRVTSDTATLEKATNDVQKYFRSNVNFGAQVVIVVTWSEVSFFGYQPPDQNPTDPRNTFQAVLIHDGSESFVFFNYEKIEWVVGEVLDGNENTGLYPETGIGIALVGFLMDGDKEYKMDFNQDNLLNLPSTSNVEIDGVYAYKVDSNSLIDPVCSNDAELGITPSRSGMMGGERIYLYGPCWAVERVQTCVFTYNGEIIQQVNATVLNINEAYCVPDPFFLVGEVGITVVKAGDDLQGSPAATYSLIESGRNTPTVTRSNSDSSIWDTTGNSLTITWTEDRESYDSTDSALTISVLAYREDSPGPRWENVYLITNSTADDGSYTFTPTAQVDVTEANAFGVIRITGNAERRQRVLWSDIHPLGYLLEQDYQDNAMQWASEKCDAWIVTDDAKSDFVDNLPACPCTLDQAEQDVGTFITDPTCYPQSPDYPDTCLKNEGATHCFLSAYASPNTESGTKCCYNDNGLLMHAGDTKYAGMSGRSHVRGASPYRETNLVPELSHWANDLIAKQFCCEWADDEKCFAYITRRPTTDCVDYQPPNTALSFGDPHFITMDGLNYTFNGLGEYTMLRYATSGSKTGPSNFELQGRQTRSRDLQGNLIDVTQLTAVAMKDSGSDYIFVEASASSGMDVHRRGADDTKWNTVYFSQQTFTDLQGCAVGVTQFERDVEIYGVVVMFKETGIGVLINYDYGMLAVRPILPSTLDSNGLSGLLGNMDGDTSNDLERRDNSTPLDEDASDQDIWQFGESWEIDTLYSNFKYSNNMDHSYYHNASYVPRMNVDLPTLYPACNDVQQCLFDYEVSNDDNDLAMATRDAYEAFALSLENIKKVDACPYLITPLNGSKTYGSDTNKYFEGADVMFECDQDLTMVGSRTKTCRYVTPEGQTEATLAWTGSEGDNQCIETVCGHLDTPVNGSIGLNEEYTVATFSCDDGFNLIGSSESICQDGAWSSGSPTCSSSKEVNVVGIAVGVTFAVIIIILLVVLGLLYYKKKNKKTSYPRKSKKPKSTDARDAELAEPLNKKPTDVRASTRSSSSQKSSEGKTGPSAQIYKPTAISQSSVKYSSGQGSTNKKPSSKPPEPVKKDTKPEPKPDPKPDPKPVETAVVNEEIPIAKETAKTENSAPPPKAQRSKTPETLRKDSSLYPASENGSYAPSTTPSVSYKTPSRDEADVVKGTGLLQNTNITGTGGWI